MRIVNLILLFVTISQGLSAQLVINASNTEGCVPLGVNIQVVSPDASTITSYAWEITTPSGGVINASSPSYVGIFSIPGNYDVSLTINDDETIFLEDYISVYDVPSADFVVDDEIGCFPLCVEYSDLTLFTGGEIVEWSWDFGNGTTSSDQNPIVCYDEPGSYTPLLSVEDEFGCYSDISFPGLIQVVDLFPTAEFTPSSFLDCNAPVEIEFDNASAGYSNLTSTWDFGDGNTEINTDTSTVINEYVGIGVFDVCLSVIDEIGCEDVMCQEVEIFDSADAEFGISVAEICAGQSIDFTNETFYVPQSFEWDFDGDGVVDSYEENPIFNFDTEGVYSPELTVVYSDNCIDTQVLIDGFEVFEAITVDFTADTLSACSLPLAVTFENLTTGAGNISYEWYVNGVLESSTEEFDFVFADWGLYDIELVAISDIGCTVSLIQNDMINLQEPSITFTQLPTLCSTSPVNLVNFTASFIDDIAEYNWDFNNDGTIDSQLDEDNVQIMYDGPGVYNINLEIISENGCVASFTSANINVTDPVVPTFTISETEVCAEVLVEFCVDGLNDETSASWNFGDTPGWTGVNVASPCIEYHYADTGLFDVSLSVFSAGCQYDTIIESAIYILGPIAIFNPQVNCDDNLDVTFTDISIAADSLYWDFGDGSPFVYNDSITTHTYAAYGEYEVTLYVFNETIGCEDLTTIPILLGNANPEVDFGPVSGCPPLLVDFPNGAWHPTWSADFGNGVLFDINFNPEDVNWDVTLNDNGDISEYVIFGPNPNIFPDVLYEEIGSYDVTFTASDDFGCSQTITYEDYVVVSSNPNFATFQMNEDEICEEILLSFTPDSADLVDIEWTFNNSFGSILESPQILFEPPYDSLIVVTLSAADADGCLSTVTQEYELTYPPEPIFNFSNSPSCIGDTLFVSNESLGDIVAYSWDFGDPDSGVLNTSTDESPSHIYTQDGNYTVCLSVENSLGCVQTLCIDNAVAIDSPEASFTYNPGVNNCLWGVQFENTSEGIITCSQWDFGDDQIGTGIAPFHTYPIGVYDVQLIICNENGCQDTTLVTDILNYGNVIGPFTQVLDITPCAPYTVDLEAFNEFDFTFEYFWDFDDGFGDPLGGTTTTHDYLEAGVYCPSLIMTDPSGCPVLIECPDSIYVEEFELSTSMISELCLGDTLLYEVSGGEAYAWNDETYITTIDEETYLIHPLVDTDFILSSTLDDCATEEVFTVIVHELPVVTLDDIADICYGEDDFELTGGLPDDGLGVYYINDIENTDFSPVWEADVNYSIEYHFTDINGCENNAFDDVFIYALPDVLFEPLGDMCQNDEIILLDQATPIGGDYFMGDSLVTEIDPALLIGSTTIEYVFTDDNVCSNSQFQDILVSPVPYIDFELGPPCEDENVFVINHSYLSTGSIDSVFWDFGPGGTSEEFYPVPFQISNAGLYDIEVEMFTDFGCASALIYEFQIFENPEPAFESVNICQFEVLELTDNSTSVEGEIDSWSWYLDDELVLNDQDFSVSMSNYGEFNITLLIESEYGCVDSLVQTTEVYPAPDVDFIVDNNCFGELTNIINQTSIPETSINGYNWTLGDGTNDDEIFSVNHLYTDPGTYEIILEAVSQFDCTASDTSEVTIYPLPEVEITSSEDIICQNGYVDFSQIASVEDPYFINGYNWYVQDSYVGNEESLTYLFDAPGSFDVSLEVVSNTGCTQTVEEDNFVLIHPTPEAGFYTDHNVVSIVNPIVHFTDNSGGADSWYYNFGDGSESILSDPNHTYAVYNEYEIMQVVMNEWGCMDTAYQIVTVDPDLIVFVPNAFTPNLDGVNELFKPVISGFDIQDYEFMIFDRWGEKLFTSNEVDQGWNGSVNHGEYWVMDGVYTWQLRVRIDGEAELFKLRGSVMVIR